MTVFCHPVSDDPKFDRGKAISNEKELIQTECSYTVVVFLLYSYLPAVFLFSYTLV